MLFKEYYLQEMSKFTPTVRKGWNKAKILKYLKGMKTSSREFIFWQTLNSYSSFEEFKNNLYYHGSGQYSGGDLKPSIVWGKRWTERDGGGGYGQQYWTISVSKSKRVAANFSGESRSVSIIPLLIKKDAKVIEMLNIKDSEELDDHLEDLWNKGIDAVYIGGGEQELCIVNPKCAVTGRSESFAVFNMKVRDPSDEDLLKIWNSREDKLKEIRELDKQKMDAKSQEKQKNLEEYEKIKELFYKSLEEYKEDKISIHKLLPIYHDFSIKAIKSLRIVEGGEGKRKLKEIVLSKDNWDKFEIKNI